MLFDYSKLKGRIIEKYGSQQTFAKVLGISEISLSRKFNNQTKFSTDDIIKVIELLEINKNEISDYFFKTLV